MAGQVVQFRISVNQTTPEVWRVVQVLEGSSLRTLKFSICEMLDWLDTENSKFLIGEEAFGDPESEFAERAWKDDSKVALRKIIKMKRRFEFVCGWNRLWKCTVEFEGLSKPKVDYRYPYCIAGEILAPSEYEGSASYEIFKKRIAEVNSDEYWSRKQLHKATYGRKPFNPLGFNRKYTNMGKIQSRKWAGLKNWSTSTNISRGNKII